MQHLLCRVAVDDKKHGEFIPGKVYNVLAHVSRHLKGKHKKAFVNVPTDGGRGRRLPPRYLDMITADRMQREGLTR
jgi:hypothetical protein